MGLFSKIRPDERRDTFAAFATLVAYMCAHAMLETARDALFLARIEPAKLPFVYLGIAVIALAVSQAQSRLSHLLRGRWLLAGWLIAAGVVTAGFWVLLSDPGNTGIGALYALYIWSGVLATLVLVHFWTLLSALFTVTQAKRVYAVIGTGGVIGAIAGSGLSGVLAGLVSAPSLLLVASFLLFLTAAGPVFLFRDPEPVKSGARAKHVSFRAAIHAVISKPYPNRVALLVLVSTVALTVADYIFKSAVHGALEADQLAAFFAWVYFGLNILSLCAQLFLVTWLVRRLSLPNALAVLPIFLMLGAVGLVFGGALLAALVIKGTDGALRHSLHRTASELLYVPMSGRLRARVKAFIDVVGQRGGQALASVAILGLTAVMSESIAPVILGGLLIVLSGLWVMVAFDLKQHYLNVFRDTLRAGFLPTHVDFPELDLASLEAWIGALNSTDDRRVLAAIDLLEAEDKVNLIPLLLLYHPEADVVERAAEVFANSGRQDFVPIADRVFPNVGPRLRAALIRARSQVKPDEKYLRQVLESDGNCAVVRTTALVALAALSVDSDDSMQALCSAHTSSNLARRALAAAIAKQPQQRFEKTLAYLLEQTEPDDVETLEVIVSAMGAMGAMGIPTLLPVLVPLLARRQLYDKTRLAILAHGVKGLTHLDSAMRDHRLPSPARRRLPGIIARFPSVLAAEILMRHLVDERDGMMRQKVIRGLQLLRNQNPGVQLDTNILREGVRSNVENAFQLLDWRVALTLKASDDPRRQTQVHSLLIRLLQGKEAHAIDRILRLLELIHPDEDVRNIGRGLRSTTPKQRSSSRELLENLLELPIREAVMALVDDSANTVDDERRLRAGHAVYKATADNYEGVLERLLASTSLSLRSLAVFHVGELGLDELRPYVEALEEAKPAYMQTLVNRVAAVLRRPGGDELAFES